MYKRIQDTSCRERSAQDRGASAQTTSKGPNRRAVDRHKRRRGRQDAGVASCLGDLALSAFYDFEPPMTRKDCKRWLEAHGYPIPQKSACLACPFHSDAEWREIKEDQEAWANVIEFDRAIRDCGGMRGKVFLHRSCAPLEEVDFSTAEEKAR